jgi:hypothetical protein
VALPKDGAGVAWEGEGQDQIPGSKHPPKSGEAWGGGGGWGLGRSIWGLRSLGGAWVGSSTTPSFGSPSPPNPYETPLFFEILAFFSKKFVPQAQVEFFVLTVGIFIL